MIALCLGLFEKKKNTLSLLCSTQRENYYGMPENWGELPRISASNFSSTVSSSFLSYKKKLVKIEDLSQT